MIISTIRNILLKINIFLSIKFFKRERRNIALSQSKSISILFEGDEADEKSILNKYEQLSKEFGITAKIYFLRIVLQQTNKYLENSITISKKDISIIGVIKNKKIMDFLNRKFDYIFTLSPTISLLEKFLISKSKAKFRVGFYNDDSIDFYDFMLKPKNNTNINIEISFENIFRHLKLVN